MRITVHYMAQIKRAAGCSSESIEVSDGVDLRATLQSLGARHGEPFDRILLDEVGEPRRALLFFVGDDHAELSRSLKDGDAVTILAPMAGG